ncbi:MAG: hypothetical protein ACYTKD_12930 [Planctomycetota bacterium]|jgi:hypothetical protein
MMRRFCRPALLLAVISVSGCYGWYGIGGGSASPSEVPLAVRAAGDSQAFDLSCEGQYLVLARVTVNAFDDMDPLAVAFVGFNAGWFASGGGPHTEREWLVAQPLVGVWSWPDAPGEVGFAAGFELGVRAMILGHPEAGSITITASRLWLSGVDGDDSMRLRGMSIRYEKFFSD